MKLRSFKARLLAGTAVWLMLALVAAGLALSLAFRRSVELAFDERLRSLLTAVIAALEVPPSGDAVMTRAIPEPRFERAYSGWYWQVTDGENHIRSRSLWDEVLGLEAIGQESDVRNDIYGPRHELLRVVDRQLRFPSRSRPIRVAVAASMAELQREIDAFDRLLLVSLAILGMGLALAVAVQVGYGLRPLRRLAEELEAVRSGRSKRLRQEYPHEVGSLVTAMNDVLEHDTRLIERARTHVGDLAHALKTPLSILSAEASRGTIEPRSVKAQVETMTRLVDHHLTRAAAAGSKRVVGALTDVGPVVEEIRATLLRLHGERELSIEVAVPRGLVFAGERQDLEEIVGNVMDNACKWASERVLIRGETERAAIRLEVEDDGPGLDPESAQSAVRRGIRFDQTTPGSGLGLSIAADLTELYGGTLRLERAALGGLRVRLDFPSA
jgi:signal transduction histidine kinase